MVHKRHPKVGARPGTLVIPENAAKPVIRVMGYDVDGVEEHENVSVAELEALTGRHAITWVDVQGLGDEATLRAIGKFAHMHPLALEDVVNVPQRPKSELFEEQQLIVVRMAMVREDEVDTEQVSLVVTKRCLVTFQERYGDVFDPVRERIRQGRGAIRAAGPGYLAYALLDVVIDAYYPILEAIGDELDDLEEEVVERAQRRTLRRIYEKKRILLDLRRALWPQRDAISSAMRDESPFISDEVRIYLRDAYDHCVQLIDWLESYREMTNGLLDVYLSIESNRTNEVMKVLTIMASIFIPLTFIAGIYGMNFDRMPELHSRWGYPIVIGIMVATALGMVLFFRRRGWLGGTPPEDA